MFSAYCVAMSLALLGTLELALAPDLKPRNGRAIKIAGLAFAVLGGG